MDFLGKAEVGKTGDITSKVRFPKRRIIWLPNVNILSKIQQFQKITLSLMKDKILIVEVHLNHTTELKGNTICKDGLILMVTAKWTENLIYSRSSINK